jgi:hypothetical protein
MTTEDQQRQLQAYLPLFVYPVHKDIRTKVVDALNRTSDAQHDGRAKVIRLARRKNAALLMECRKVVAMMPSGIWEEVKVGLEEVRA